MNHFDDKQFSKFVRHAIGSVSEHDLQQDLWPQMRLKLNDPGIRLRWSDFILAFIVVIVCVSVPEALTGLLFNL